MNLLLWGNKIVQFFYGITHCILQLPIPLLFLQCSSCVWWHRILIPWTRSMVEQRRSFATWKNMCHICTPEQFWTSDTHELTRGSQRYLKRRFTTVLSARSARSDERVVKSKGATPASWREKGELAWRVKMRRLAEKFVHASHCAWLLPPSGVARTSVLCIRQKLCQIWDLVCLHLVWCDLISCIV